MYFCFVHAFVFTTFSLFRSRSDSVSFCFFPFNCTCVQSSLFLLVTCMHQFLALLRAPLLAPFPSFSSSLSIPLSLSLSLSSFLSLSHFHSLPLSFTFSVPLFFSYTHLPSLSFTVYFLPSLSLSLLAV